MPAAASSGGGTGALEKAGDASHLAAKRDNRRNRSGNPKLGRTVLAKVYATTVVTSACDIFIVPASQPSLPTSDAILSKCF